jgi:hypothetical protein
LIFMCIYDPGWQENDGRAKEVLRNA